MLITRFYLVPILRHDGAIPTLHLTCLEDVDREKRLTPQIASADTQCNASSAGVWQMLVFLCFVCYFPLFFSLIYLLSCTALKIGSAGSTLHTSVDMQLPSV